MTTRAIVMVRKDDQAISVKTPDGGQAIPFRFKEDMDHFKRSTTGGVLIVGRKTFEEMGSRPLPGRETWVLTRSSPSVDPGKYRIFNDRDQVVKAISQESRDIWVIGGEQVYRAMLPYCREVLITEVTTSDLREPMARFPLEYQSDYWRSRMIPNRMIHRSCEITGKASKLEFSTIKM